MSVNLQQQMGDTGFAFEGTVRKSLPHIVTRAGRRLKACFGERLVGYEEPERSGGLCLLRFAVNTQRWGTFSMSVSIIEMGEAVCSMYAPMFLPDREVDEAAVVELATFLARLRRALTADFVEITLDDAGEGPLRNCWIGAYDASLFQAWFEEEGISWKTVNDSAVVRVRTLAELPRIRLPLRVPFERTAEHYERYIGEQT